MVNTAHNIFSKIVIPIRKHPIIIISLLLISIFFTKFILQLLLVIGVILIAGFLLFKALVYLFKISFFLMRFTLGTVALILAISGLIWIIGFSFT